MIGEGDVRVHPVFVRIQKCVLLAVGKPLPGDTVFKVILVMYVGDPVGIGDVRDASAGIIRIFFHAPVHHLHFRQKTVFITVADGTPDAVLHGDELVSLPEKFEVLAAGKDDFLQGAFAVMVGGAVPVPVRDKEQLPVTVIGPYQAGSGLPHPVAAAVLFQGKLSCSAPPVPVALRRLKERFRMVVRQNDLHPVVINHRTAEQVQGPALSHRGVLGAEQGLVGSLHREPAGNVVDNEVALFHQVASRHHVNGVVALFAVVRVFLKLFAAVRSRSCALFLPALRLLLPCVTSGASFRFPFTPFLFHLLLIVTFDLALSKLRGPPEEHGQILPAGRIVQIEFAVQQGLPDIPARHAHVQDHVKRLGSGGECFDNRYDGVDGLNRLTRLGSGLGGCQGCSDGVGTRHEGQKGLGGVYGRTHIVPLCQRDPHLCHVGHRGNAGDGKHADDVKSTFRKVKGHVTPGIILQLQMLIGDAPIRAELQIGIAFYLDKPVSKNDIVGTHLDHHAFQGQQVHHAVLELGRCILRLRFLNAFLPGKASPELLNRVKHLERSHQVVFHVFF